MQVKIKKFLKSLFVGLIVVNFPFPIWGFMLGWPSVVLSSVILTIMSDYIDKLDKLQAALTFINICFLSSFFVFLLRNFSITESFALLQFAAPSIVVGCIWFLTDKSRLSSIQGKQS